MSQENEPVTRPQFEQEPPSLSYHAQQRLAQRNLDQRAIDYVLRHGRLIRRTGVQFYVLGARDIPLQDRRRSSITRLIGTTILVARDGTIITVYRNRRTLRAIARKRKHWTDLRRIAGRSASID